MGFSPSPSTVEENRSEMAFRPEILPISILMFSRRTPLRPQPSRNQSPKEPFTNAKVESSFRHGKHVRHAKLTIYIRPNGITDTLDDVRIFIFGSAFERVCRFTGCRLTASRTSLFEWGTK